jgi:hypothetical protein
VGDRMAARSVRRRAASAVMSSACSVLRVRFTFDSDANGMAGGILHIPGRIRCPDPFHSCLSI